MKNKISKEKKYHYVKRYLEGESPTVLGREINWKVKSPKDIIFRWHRLYLKGGVMALEDKRGTKSKVRKPKKSKLDPDKMERDELLDYVKIMEETIKLYDDFLKKKMRSRFLYNFVLIMKEKFNRPITWLCKFYSVSTSGYYDWVKNPQFTNNYNEKWLNIIKNEYELHNGIYGAERIWGSLASKNELTMCLSTIKRYLRFLGLKAKIRNPKGKREIKETSVIDRNYVNRNFRDVDSRSKVFTDTSEYGIQYSKVYFSAVLDSNQTLHSLDVSLRNNEDLIQKNISEGVKKIGRKYIIHFDNAAFYKNKNMKELVKKTNGIRSHSYPGRSLDNRPIEYFWSILKQEYLNQKDFKSIENIRKEIPKIIFHYNHIRIQKNLYWKTPAQARV